MKLPSLPVLVSLLLWIVPANAQTVRVLILDPATFVPTAGGYVLLLDDTDAEVARSLNAGEGLLAILAPNAGRYRLASVRVGFHTIHSEPFDIEVGQSTDATLDLAHERVDLTGVGETEANVCLSPDNPTVGLVWEEITKVLEATVWDGRDGLDYYSIMYDRDTDAEDFFVFAEQTNITEGLVLQVGTDDRQPFIVQRPDSGIAYNPPTVATLLSDRFVTEYCFRITGGEQSVTLEFETKAATDDPDISGSFLVDVETGHLRSFAYRFLNVPHGIDGYQADGRIAFMPGPSGRWLASEWELRTPTVVSDQDDQPTLAGMRRVGGVVGAITRGDDVVYSAPLAELTGVVLDSAGVSGMAGAEVTLAGTDYSAITDGQGRFRIAGPLDGEYLVSFAHGQFERDGLFTRDTTVVLGVGHEATISLQPYSGEDYLMGLMGNGGGGREPRGARGASGKPIDSRNIITREEIDAAASRDLDVLTLISRIRGIWKRTRGTQGFTGFVAVPVAFRNGQYLGTLDILESILLENVEEIWYFDRVEARHRYGNRFAGAVIDVIDRR